MKISYRMSCIKRILYRFWLWMSRRGCRIGSRLCWSIVFIFPLALLYAFRSPPWETRKASRASEFVLMPRCPHFLFICKQKKGHGSTPRGYYVSWFWLMFNLKEAIFVKTKNWRLAHDYNFGEKFKDITKVHQNLNENPPKEQQQRIFVRENNRLHKN